MARVAIDYGTIELDRAFFAHQWDDGERGRFAHQRDKEYGRRGHAQESILAWVSEALVVSAVAIFAEMSMRHGVLKSRGITKHIR